MLVNYCLSDDQMDMEWSVCSYFQLPNLQTVALLSQLYCIYFYVRRRYLNEVTNYVNTSLRHYP